ncbi:MAG: nucleotidyltransferase [Clostridiales bacterium]|nr:nucleotidyltransferase [Clostridiales bacterium]MDU3240406.1 nucleotidyltransferase [Clostridiales bacterium]
MKNTTLVIMAAGIGSRFGGGIKQLEPVGPAGEIIMDYSIHDALEAGFNKIVFIIRKDLEKDFKEIIGKRIEKIADVSYAFQELDDLPEGFLKPADRTKPWGTGQAILCCKGLLNEPFIVINADDYYGKEAFVKIHDYLVNWTPVPGKFNFCMAGFILGNTLSDNGGVTRGVCNIDENYHLADVDETSDIIKTEEGAAIRMEDGSLKPIDEKSYVSMNMWGFTPDLLDELETGFAKFLSGIKEGDIKKEYLLPIIVDQLIKSDKAQVTLLETNDKWFGVTYKEDMDTVVESFCRLIAEGVYSNPLLP